MNNSQVPFVFVVNGPSCKDESEKDCLNYSDVLEYSVHICEFTFYLSTLFLGITPRTHSCVRARTHEYEYMNI